MGKEMEEKVRKSMRVEKRTGLYPLVKEGGWFGEIWRSWETGKRWR